MKIWQLLSPKNLTHADRDLPAPQEGYAKVKITRALLSEADVAVYSGATRVKYPVVPGRYAVGQVVEAGENSYFNKGDRVYLADAVENEESESGIDVAGENRDGFYRDFAFVNASEAYTLPPSVSDEAAFLIDAVATAEKIVDETGVGAGQHVLVIGGGLYANILCQILIYHRAVPVLADNNAERLALAKKCGIYYTFPYDDTLRDNLLRITGGALADAAVWVTDLALLMANALAAALFIRSQRRGRLNLWPLLTVGVTMFTFTVDVADNAWMAMLLTALALMGWMLELLLTGGKNREE